MGVGMIAPPSLSAVFKVEEGGKEEGGRYAGKAARGGGGLSGYGLKNCKRTRNALTLIYANPFLILRRT